MFHSCSWHCNTFGKNFQQTDTGTFYPKTFASCQHNRTWSRASIPDPCEWSHCVDPPAPPAASKETVFNIGGQEILKAGHAVKYPPTNLLLMFECRPQLKLVWNSQSPPAHQQTVKYQCDAGNRYNRFVTDFSKNKYYLTCLPNNTFSDPAWPTCIDG